MNLRLGVVTLTLLGAFALRTHALGAKSLWYDELRQIEVSQHEVREFPAELAAHAARPLDYLLTRALLAAGRQEFWLRLPAVLWGTLSVALTYALARRALGPETALLAAALIAASPLAVHFAQELRPYALYLLFALASYLSLDTALSSRQARTWVVFALASIGGALTHYFYAFLLVAQAVYLGALLIARGARWSHAFRFSASIALAGAGFLVAAHPPTLVRLARGFVGALARAPLGGLLSDPSGRGAADPLDLAFFADGLLPAFGAGAGAPLILFNLLALSGLIALAARHRRALAQLLPWLAVAPGLIILYLQYRQEFFANRYVLFALPAYLIVAAHGLIWLSRRLAARWRFRRPTDRTLRLLGLLALLGFSLAAVERGYRLPKDDWRRVGRFLAANVRAGDRVGAPDVQAFIRFYAPDLRGVLVDANDLGPHEQALIDGERFWFVRSEYTLVPVEETRGWAEQIPGVVIALDPTVRVIFVHPGLTQAEMLEEARGFVIPPPSLPGSSALLP